MVNRDGVRASIWLAIEGVENYDESGWAGVIDWAILQFKKDNSTDTAGWQYWDSKGDGKWNDINASIAPGTYKLTMAYEDGKLLQYINDNKVNEYNINIDEGLSAPTHVIIQSYSFGESYSVTWKVPTVKYLESEADKSELESKIEEAQALNEEDYTEESWALFGNALENAIQVLEDEDATQKEVNIALAELEAAMEGLTEKPEEPVVDKEELESKIEEAQSLNEEDYTEETWLVLENALENAIQVLEDEDATQEEVDIALAALIAAMEGLIENPVVVTVIDIQDDAVVGIGIPGVLTIWILEDNMFNTFEGITTDTTFNVFAGGRNITLVYDEKFTGWIPEPIDIQGLTRAELEAGIVTINE